MLEYNSPMIHDTCVAMVTYIILDNHGNVHLWVSFTVKAQLPMIYISIPPAVRTSGLYAPWDQNQAYEPPTVATAL